MMHFAQKDDIIDLTSDTDGDVATLSKTLTRVPVPLLEPPARNDRVAHAAIPPPIHPLSPQSSNQNPASTSAQYQIPTDLHVRDPPTKKRPRAPSTLARNIF